MCRVWPRRVACIAVMAWALWPCIAAAEQRVALVMGNGAYLHQKRLKNPAQDAAAMARLLQGIGFTVETAIDQDRSGMEKVIERFERRLPGADLALLFYAGHGVQVGGENYLIPADAALHDEPGIRHRTLPLQPLVDRIQETAKVGVIILDACRDNPFLNRMLASGRSLATRGVELVAARPGDIAILYATSPGAKALDGPGRNSPFTEALVEYLGQPGLALQQAMTRVASRVAERTGNRQVPWSHWSLRQEIYLGPRGADAIDDETKLWRSFEKTGQADDFAFYLRRYPGGRYVHEAKGRLRALGGADASRGRVLVQPLRLRAVEVPISWKDPFGLDQAKMIGLNSIWGSGKNDAWAVGHEGAIFSWNGREWKPWKPMRKDSKTAPASDNRTGVLGLLRDFAPPTTKTLHAVWGRGRSEVWAVGEEGTVIRFDGRDWQSMPNPTTRRLFGVWGTGTSTIWAVGEGGVIVRWDGVGWNSVPSPVRGSLRGIWGSGDACMWAVGEGGTTVTWDRERWRAVPGPSKADLFGVWGSGGNDVWAVGDRSTIMRWDGVEWSLTPNPGTGGALYGVWGSGPTDVWAVGRSESYTEGILRWDGLAWKRVPGPAVWHGPSFSGVWGSGATDVWIVGDWGPFIRYQP